MLFELILYWVLEVSIRIFTPTKILLILQITKMSHLRIFWYVFIFVVLPKFEVDVNLPSFYLVDVNLKSLQEELHVHCRCKVSQRRFYNRMTTMNRINKKIISAIFQPTLMISVMQHNNFLKLQIANVKGCIILKRHRRTTVGI